LDGFKLTFVFNEIMLRKGVGVNKWRLGPQVFVNYKK
jgi:hypothetical protein